MNIRLILPIFPNHARLLLCAYIPNLPILSAVSRDLDCENRKKKIKSKYHTKPDGQKH